MKLAVVFTVLGQHEMATIAIQHALDNCVVNDTHVYVIDNGGDYTCPINDPRLKVLTPEKNIGVYPAFKYGFDNVEGDILAFLHSDLIILEKGYDERIIKAFEGNAKIGLIGFVGSNEIDSNGGRGGGTTSNFQGSSYRGSVPINNELPGTAFAMWTGSPAEAHGMRNAAYTNAAVVDGCAMVIRRSAWEKIGYREGFPPHHFYDRLISTQMLEAGLEVGVLGIACDHISGQTVGGQAYVDFAKEWATKHIPPDRWVGNPPHWNADMTVYREAESQWLHEYRDQKHIVPIRV